MWNVKTKGLPPIAMATGTISKSLRQYLNSVPGKHDIRNYRKQPYWELRARTSGSTDVEVQNIYHAK